MLEVAPAFDTLRYAKLLVGGGFTEQQAETLAEAQAGAIHASLATKDDVDQIKLAIETLRQDTKKEIARVELAIETLRQETQKDIETLREATKKDIETLRRETQVAIETLRNETRKDIQENAQAVKAEILKWMFGALAAQAALIVGLIRLLG